MLKKLCVFGALVLTSACAPHTNWRGRIRGNAPSSTDDTGVVVQGAKPEDVSAILDHNPKAKVRTLNENHGMYEIFNVTLDDVRADYQGVAEKNTYMAMGAPEHRRGWVKPGAVIGQLDPCAEGNDAPDLQLNVSANGKDLNHQTMRLGAPVHIDARGGEKSEILITTAMGSATAMIERTSAQSDFTPDAMGLYKVRAVVQGKNGVCTTNEISFAVTDFEPFRQATEPADPIDLTQFSHLKLVSAAEAWKYAQGEGMILAVIDSGVNYNNPSVNSNILVNYQEKPANGIDDDNNGWVDDYVGLDLVNNSGWPDDDTGHGSNVACLAASRDFGIARKAKILPIKALGPLGGDVATIAAAVRFAVDRGANVINMSMGSPQTPPQVLIDALKYAESKNVIVVAATGNGDPRTGVGYDIDARPVYPASLHLSNMITVAAFDDQNALSPYSNFGAKSADVTAPGGSRQAPIFSCNYRNPRGLPLVGMEGTSMAAPIASGTALSVWSLRPKTNFQNVRERVVNSGPEVSELKSLTVSGRHLDTLRAVASASASF